MILRRDMSATFQPTFALNSMEDQVRGFKGDLLLDAGNRLLVSSYPSLTPY